MFLKLKDIKIEPDEVINIELTLFNKIILIYALFDHIASIRRVREAARRNVMMLDYFRRPGGA